ncbi:helix-turn-helix domain-containing protein [Arsenophonus nasoniae]|uniref:Helix-turn-helix transcriptional regulator n=1 Tax=Arsenophonus nasoniae TaxID=638 RepID=A0AA95GBN9_9GAMM|nr:helix-turn-helix transcriptional regulator [Arsenophonus nasoniae]WGL94145.1 helix-turn-helix transcriptional regulator [Arsenophonus nasoniae]
MITIDYGLINMSFSQRVVTLRKQRGLTQQGLSDATGIHVQQIKRYESGSSLPTADALKKLAVVLHVTSDFLLFETEEREPKDDMKLRFEALAAMSATDQAVVKAVIDAIMVKSQVTQAVTEVSKNTRHGVKKDK